MNRRQCLRRLSLASLATLVGCGCHSAPTTGRKQLLLMPEGQEVSLGADAFHQMLEDEPDSQNTHWVELVERVGHRIAAQSDRPDTNGNSKWSQAQHKMLFACRAVRSQSRRHSALCQDEAGLAVVMSHEVAHALARHGGEEDESSFAVDQTKQAISFMTRNQEETRRKMIMKAYGVGTEYVVLLPYNEAGIGSRPYRHHADEPGRL